MPRKYSSLGDRIVANSVISSDSFYDGLACWNWIGARVTNRGGKFYGKMSIRKRGRLRTFYAHRIAIVELGFKVLRSRQVVMHLCNNTLCVNPAHLASGTQRKNIRQCVKEGRHYAPWRKK